jgi:hypothetical protein
MTMATLIFSRGLLLTMASRVLFAMATT